MRILSVCLVNVIRRSFFQLTAQSGTFLILRSKVNTCRTFVLSTCLNKNSLPDATEKLNLDGWKDLMRTTSQEETSEKDSDAEEDPNLTATKELIEVLRLTTKLVPENISEEQFQNLLELPTKTSKKKYLAFLFKRELKKKAEKEKKEKKKESSRETCVEKNSSNKPENRLIKSFWSKSEDIVHSWRVAQSMIFGQPLVFDMSYENEMSQKEIKYTVKQMMECEAFNRRAKDPFHFHYCSLTTDSPYHKEFVKRYGEAWDKLLVTVSEKAYVEIFPRDQIVYLTADSPNEMKKFENDKIYIIGCLVDGAGKPGISFARAKRLNLATARLPLDRYLDWQIGGKNLTLNQMACILLALKDTGDWKEALKFVPQRKHSGFVGTSLTETGIGMKTKTNRITASQGVSHFAAKSSNRQTKIKWWEDVSS
nr:mitochondrial ribonuclease P protein 1 [Pogona vitticeps]XP_020640558.1 mitochondrial ribonuclease P protein 1 [Pogona vitticeps]